MNQLQSFQHSKFGELQILIKDGKEFFPATDVARTLGYSDPHKAIKQHTKQDGWVNHPVTDSLGRTQQKKFINEGNLYRLIVRSKLPEAEKFEQWVFDEVLPTIRKTGGYVSEDREEEFIRNYFPSFSDEVKQAMILDLKKQNSDLKQKLKLQKPKVLFADAVETSESSILVGELAKILIQNGVKTVSINGKEKKMGQNNLFIWLRDNGYLCKKKGEMFNLPTQYSIDNGLFEIKKRTQQNPDGSIRVTRTPKVTGKGQIYFVNKFLEDQTAVVAL